MNGVRPIQQFVPNGYYPNGVGEGAGVGMALLPLNVIALIIRYVDDVADLARICRTCRVIHYLTLPQLYRDVHLKSHAEPRVDEGVNGEYSHAGRSSALLMGLSGLTTRNYSHLVRSLTISGEWSEDEDGAGGGRVKDKGDYIPQKSMMLSIILRSAIDRMDKLESFTWELDAKPLQTVYQGLALRPNLTSLTIKFPSSRIPRPIVTIPGMPNLRLFKVTNIDPLCYSDDISLLLLQSGKLQDLRLHWSPRIRRNHEHSITLQTYFGRCIVAGVKLPIRHLSFQNMYAFNNDELEKVINIDRLVSFTSLNAGPQSDPHTGEPSFIDQSWITRMPEVNPKIKHMRTDCVVRQHAIFLTRFTGVEELFLVNPREVDIPTPTPSSANTPIQTPPPPRSPFIPSVPQHHSPSPTASNNLQFPGTRTPGPPASDSQLSSLAREFLQILLKHHGKTLRKLLLSPAWRLNHEELALLVRSCPHLVELGLGLQVVHADVMRLLLPFLPRLRAFRLLADPAHPSELCGLHGTQCALSGPEYDAIEYLGIGEAVFEVGRTVPLEGGMGEFRPVKQVSREAVQHLDIWRLDCEDI